MVASLTAKDKMDRKVINPHEEKRDGKGMGSLAHGIYWRDYLRKKRESNGVNNATRGCVSATAARMCGLSLACLSWSAHVTRQQQSLFSAPPLPPFLLLLLMLSFTFPAITHGSHKNEHAEAHASAIATMLKCDETEERRNVFRWQMLTGRAVFFLFSSFWPDVCLSA